MGILVAVKNFIEVRWIRKFRNREDIEKYQDKMIKEQLEFMKNNSPYYKNINTEKIDEIDIVDKKTMMDNFERMNTLGLDKDEALKIAIESEHTRDFSKKYDGISVGLSSGTSGHRGLFVLSDKETMQWAGAILAKLLPEYNLIGHRIAFFLRADNNLYEAINSVFIKFKFFDLLVSMEENMKELEKYTPTILVAPASVLKEIGKEKLSKKIDKISPKKIISVAEVLTEKDERFIKKAFNKEIIHQVYQCTEGFLAYTCKYGNIHVNEDIVKIEKEEIDKERFIPIITDFYRKTQPIIRYRLNDVLVSTNKKCECKCPFMIIDKIEGREDDIFIFESSLLKEKEVQVYSDFISRCLVYVPDITNYRVVQTDKKHIIVYIDNMDKVITENITKEFKRLSERKKFRMPEIEFKEYETEKNKKVKRVERRF